MVSTTLTRAGVRSTHQLCCRHKQMCIRDSPFGAGQMRKEQIDAVVDSHVQSLVDDSLRGIVQCYLKENKAIEAMYAQQDGGEPK